MTDRYTRGFLVGIEHGRQLQKAEWPTRTEDHHMEISPNEEEVCSCGLDWPCEVAALRTQLAEARKAGTEYIKLTDPLLFCSEELTCGECRGCLQSKLAEKEAEVEALKQNWLAEEQRCAAAEAALGRAHHEMRQAIEFLDDLEASDNTACDPENPQAAGFHMVRQGLAALLAPDPEPVQDPQPAWVCKARTSKTDPPQDCDWPTCGCDPAANKVLEAIEEAGFKIVKRWPVQAPDLSKERGQAEGVETVGTPARGES